MTKSEFERMPLLSSFFPLKFESGACWTVMTCHCAGCKEEIADADTRGSVTRPFGGYVIEGFGYCRKCEALTPITVRMMPDLTIVGPSPRTGEWCVWGPERPWWRRVIEWIGGL